MTYLKMYAVSRGDGTWTNSYLVNGIINVDIEWNYGESIPQCIVKTVSNPSRKIGNEIRIYTSESNPNPSSNSELLFRGTIEKIEVEYKYMTLTCEDWLARTKHIVSTRNFTGTNSIVSMLQTLCNDAGLGHNTTGLTNLPITQLTDYDCRNSTVFEKLQQLCEMIDSWFYYNPVTQAVVFVYKTNADSVSLITRPDANANLLSVPKWGSDASNVINVSRAKGGNFNEYVVQNGAYVGRDSSDMYNVVRFSGYTGSLIKLEVNYGSGYGWYDDTDLLFGNSHYKLQAPNGTTQQFNIWSPSSTQYPMKVTYAVPYNEVIKTSSDSASMVTFGQRQKTIDANNFKSNTSIQDFANKIVQFWKNGTVNIDLIVDTKKLGIDARSLIGRKVNITDSINNKTYTFGSNGWYGVVTSASFSYPGTGTTINISDHALKNPSYISAMYNAINNLLNNISDAGINNNIKNDGSTPMNGTLNMGGNTISNFSVQTTDRL